MSFFNEAQSYELVSADGESCIVCGARGTNCVGESHSSDQIRFIPNVPVDDPFATFTVPERIYVEETKGKRTVRTLLYPKGARIRPEVAKKLGLMP